jgi:DNA-binding CsgD family transcriptional regulator
MILPATQRARPGARHERGDHGGAVVRPFANFMRQTHPPADAGATVLALELLAQAALLLDRAGRILQLNALAIGLLERHDGLGAWQGALHAATAAQTEQLHGVLAAAIGGDGVPARAGALRLAKPSGGTPLMLFARPFHGVAARPFARRPAALICVVDVDHAAPRPPAELARLFGLTEKEAALAAALMQGHDLAGIAARSGRSIATLRTHLARLMAKAGVNRQSALMRLLMSLPAVHV